MGNAMDVGGWPMLARSAMWIVGLAVVLATVSHASWRASVQDDRLSRTLAAPAASAGLLLITLSLAWGAEPTWSRFLWALASAILAGRIFILLRRT